MSHYLSMVTYLAGKIIPAVFTLLIMIFGIRFFGESEFGKFTLYNNAAILVSTFCIGWLQQSTLRFAAGTETAVVLRKQIFLFTFWSAVISAMAISLIVLFYFHLPLFETSLIASFTFVFSCLSLSLAWLQAKFRSVKYALIESSYYILILLFGVLLYFYAEMRDYRIFFLAMTGAGLSGLILFFNKAFRAARPSIHKGIDNITLRKFMSFGLPMTWWLFVSYLFNITDRFIIEYFEGFSSVGTYTVVYDFVYKTIGFACLPVLLTLHPSIAQAFNKSQFEESRMLIRKGILLVGIIFTCALLFIIIFREFIFHQIFHLSEKNLLWLILPLVLSAALWQMAMFIHKPLELRLLQKHLIYAIVISLAVNTMLNVILIPRYSYYAAAGNMLIGTLVYIGCVSMKINKIKYQFNE